MATGVNLEHIYKKTTWRLNNKVLNFIVPGQNNIYQDGDRHSISDIKK